MKRLDKVLLIIMLLVIAGGVFGAVGIPSMMVACGVLVGMIVAFLPIIMDW